MKYDAFNGNTLNWSEREVQASTWEFSLPRREIVTAGKIGRDTPGRDVSSDPDSFLPSWGAKNSLSFTIYNKWLWNFVYPARFIMLCWNVLVPFYFIVSLLLCRISFIVSTCIFFLYIFTTNVYVYVCFYILHVIYVVYTNWTKNKITNTITHHLLIHYINICFLWRFWGSNAWQLFV